MGWKSRLLLPSRGIGVTSCSYLQRASISSLIHTPLVLPESPCPWVDFQLLRRLWSKFPGASCYGLIPQRANPSVGVPPYIFSTQGQLLLGLAPIPAMPGIECGDCSHLRPFLSPVPPQCALSPFSLLSHVLSAASFPRFGLIFISDRQTLSSASTYQ